MRRIPIQTTNLTLLDDSFDAANHSNRDIACIVYNVI